jgi:hypothetical protein
MQPLGCKAGWETNLFFYHLNRTILEKYTIKLLLIEINFIERRMMMFFDLLR